MYAQKAPSRHPSFPVPSEKHNRPHYTGPRSALANPTEAADSAIHGWILLSACLTPRELEGESHMSENAWIVPFF